MFTKRIKAMSAAMSGKLSFSGNTKKAMAFQRVQKDMQRIYQQARDVVGDPGDLSTIDKISKPELEGGQTSLRRKASTGAGISAPTLLKVGDIRDEILQVNNELYEKSYITPTGGNVSARTEDNPEEIWITPSQIFKGDLEPEMMIRIDLDGNLLEESEYTASSERRVHCAIYRARPDVMAIAHTHAKQVTMMGLAGFEFLPLSTEAVMVGDIPVVPFIMPGSDELGDAVAEALGEGMAVLMQNHGLVVAAETLRRAADITDIIEVNADKIITCKKLGIDPPVLPDDVVQTLREIGGMKG
jgi:autoinducer 2 (AI-2) kinase